jgi:hypothetical protein
MRAHGMPALAAPRASILPAALRGLQLQDVIYWILRVGAAGCYIGHGAFGIITKKQWLPYFALVGIPESVAYRLMPVIGVMDITMGLLLLLFPRRALLFWAAFWTTWTALLRPLTGEGWWEFFERGGNYGIPLAFLALTWQPPTWRDWVVRQARPALTRSRAEAMAWIFRLTTAALLIGHGGFGAFMHKQVWFGYFGALGIGAATVRSLSLIPAVGWFEIALGVAVLVRPLRQLLLFVFAWKVGTEFLRLVAGEPVWEFIERFGSYTAPLALVCVQLWLGREARAESAVKPGTDRLVASRLPARDIPGLDGVAPALAGQPHQGGSAEVVAAQAVEAP